MVLWIFLCLVLGYLVGSIPFALIISRFKGIDIRKIGSKNPGAGNVYKNVSKKLGILCYLLDCLKAIAVMAIAQKLFGLPPFWVGITGIAAIVGHCWSCLLGFKGGKGVAVSSGVLLYLVPKIVLVCIGFWFLFQIKKLRKWWLIIIALASFGYLAHLFYGEAFSWLGPVIMISIGLGIVINRDKILSFLKKKFSHTSPSEERKSKTKKPLARKLYRIIMGSIFPIVYWLSPNKWIVLGIIAFFLILVSILEWARRKYPGLWPYITGKWYGKILKKKTGKILGTTWFLIGSFIVILFFPKPIAIVALLFNAFGDAVSTLIGLRYGKIKLVGEKTLEGSLAFFIISMAVGFLLISFTGITLPYLVIIIGALAGTLAELTIPTKIDDNVSIPLITAVVMTIVKVVL